MMTNNSPNITRIEIQNGSITFFPAVEAEPAVNRSETNGNVTVNTIRSEVGAIPDYFSAVFTIKGFYEIDGVEFSNWLNVESVVTSNGRAAPYHDVEDAAARQIPGMLRQMADKVEESFKPNEA
jgi:hypothetical protein